MEHWYPGETARIWFEVIDEAVAANNPVTGLTIKAGIRRESDGKWWDFVGSTWDTFASWALLESSNLVTLTDEGTGAYSTAWDQSASGDTEETYHVTAEVTAGGADYQDRTETKQYRFSYTGPFSAVARAEIQAEAEDALQAGLVITPYAPPVVTRAASAQFTVRVQRLSGALVDSTALGTLYVEVLRSRNGGAYELVSSLTAGGVAAQVPMNAQDGGWYISLGSVELADGVDAWADDDQVVWVPYVAEVTLDGVTTQVLVDPPNEYQFVTQILPANIPGSSDVQTIVGDEVDAHVDALLTGYYLDKLLTGYVASGTPTTTTIRVMTGGSVTPTTTLLGQILKMTSGDCEGEVTVVVGCTGGNTGGMIPLGYWDLTVSPAFSVAPAYPDTLAIGGLGRVDLVNDAITSAKFDESTAFPVKSADTGATAIARTGADSDTLKTLSDQVDTVKAKTDLIPASPAAVGSAMTLANDAIAEAQLAADVDVYEAKVRVIVDESNNEDSWVALVYKNGTIVTSGVMLAKLTVYQMNAAGTVLLNAVTLLQAGSTGYWYYDASGSSQTTEGVAYVAKVTATIDGGSRTMADIVPGRDSGA